MKMMKDDPRQMVSKSSLEQQLTFRELVHILEKVYWLDGVGFYGEEKDSLTNTGGIKPERKDL